MAVINRRDVKITRDTVHTWRMRWLEANDEKSWEEYLRDHVIEWGHGDDLVDMEGYLTPVVNVILSDAESYA